MGVPSICPEKPLWSLIPRVFGPCPWDSFGHRKFGTRHELKELAWNARGRRTWLSDQQRLSDLNERLSDLRIPNWDRLVRVLTHLCWFFFHLLRLLRGLGMTQRRDTFQHHTPFLSPLVFPLLFYFESGFTHCICLELLFICNLPSPTLSACFTFDDPLKACFFL